MKKTLVMFLGAILVALGFTILGSATEAKAKVELPPSIKKGEDVLIEKYLDNAVAYTVDGETVESFNPAKYATYGFVAQRLYLGYHYGKVTELPSQKKAITWLQSIYCEMAKRYPEQAEELAEAFLDGRGEKWSYKKKASYDFLEKTIVTLSYYVNDGAYVKYAPFSVDNFRLFDIYADGAVGMRDWYYSKWKNYGGSSKYPSRIAAISMMSELVIQIYNPGTFGKNNIG